MQNNPLRQFFRRPAVYLKLPSGGKGYELGSLEIPDNGELPVYPMTAIDEISVRTPDALYNGSAVANVIKSCIPNIKDPWKLNSNDLDAVFIAIRAASGNQVLDISTLCPKCENEAEYGINLISILSNLKYGDYDALFEVSDLKIKFRPLNYKEMTEVVQLQFELQKRFKDVDSIEDLDQKTKVTLEGLKAITEATMLTLTQSIDYIETPNSRVDDKEFIKDFLQNCDTITYTSIRDYSVKLKASTELEPVNIKCTNCSHEYQQPFTLNPSDFFG